MWPERFCLFCGTQLPAQKRADAFFCAERHEAAWRKARKLVRTSALLADLEKRLDEHAPKQACWYRLMLLVEDASWIYPALGRPAVRFDGRQRQTFGFHLRPYEPPLVPKRGQYTLTLYDSLGQQIPTLSYGVTGEQPAATGASLVPARSPAIKSPSAIEKDSKVNRIQGILGQEVKEEPLIVGGLLRRIGFEPARSAMQCVLSLEMTEHSLLSCKFRPFEKMVSIIP